MAVRHWFIPLNNWGPVGSSGVSPVLGSSEVASGWISSVRSWLSLPADGSLATGWRAVARGTDIRNAGSSIMVYPLVN